MRITLLLLLLAANCLTNTVLAQHEILALKGATVIDVENFGKSTRDIKNAVVIIKGSKILSVGPASKVKVPADAKVIDVTGKYILPGLIEGFGSVTNQAFANAYLYLGVTTVVTVEDARRGKTFYDGSPSPALYKQDAFYGCDRVEVTNKPYRFDVTNYRDDKQIHHEIDSMAKGGAKVMLIHYGVKAEQLPAIVDACKKNNLPALGELGFTSYRDAVRAGIKSFVHTSRYTADILPDSVRAIYSYAPFGPPSSYYYEYIQTIRISEDKKLRELADLFRNNRVGLMPTETIIAYTTMPFSKNPWKEPVAQLIDEKDIPHEPLDKETGKPRNPSPLRTKAGPLLMSIDSLFIRKGVRYLAGSGATAFGTMPGISLINELESLAYAGLTTRQAIAAATNNFSLLWGWKHIGKVEAGRDADILVLSANPLETLDNLKKIDILLVKGRLIERNQLLKK